MNTIKNFPKLTKTGVFENNYPEKWFKKTLILGLENEDEKYNDLASKLFFNGGKIPINKNLPEEYIKNGIRMLKAIIGSYEPKHEDKMTVYRARKIEKFFSQPFTVAEQFTGFQGKYVKLEDSISGFEKIIAGELDEVPEEFFMYKGDINEVWQAYEDSKKKDK